MGKSSPKTDYQKKEKKKEEKKKRRGGLSSNLKSP